MTWIKPIGIAACLVVVAGCGSIAFSSATIVSATADRTGADHVDVAAQVACQQIGSATCADEPTVCVTARFLDDGVLIDESEVCEVVVPVDELQDPSPVALQSTIPIPHSSPRVQIELSIDYGSPQYVLEAP